MLTRICIDGDCSNVLYDLSNYYNKQEVNALIGQMSSITFEVVDELPETGDASTIYLVDDGQGGYDQYIYTEDEWVQIGTTSVDLSDYVAKSELLNMVYPVGALYMSTSNTSPATLFGGTWERIKDRFILASGDTYTNVTGTGGAATVTLNANQGAYPAISVNTATGYVEHSHNPNSTQDQFLVGSGLSRTRTAISSTGDRYTHTTTVQDNLGMRASTTTVMGGHTHSISIPAHNAAQSHNNMPPYIIVNVWRRTA